MREVLEVAEELSLRLEEQVELEDTEEQLVRAALADMEVPEVLAPVDTEELGVPEPVVLEAMEVPVEPVDTVAMPAVRVQEDMEEVPVELEVMAAQDPEQVDTVALPELVETEEALVVMEAQVPAELEVMEVPVEPELVDTVVVLVDLEPVVLEAMEVPVEQAVMEELEVLEPVDTKEALVELEVTEAPVLVELEVTEELVPVDIREVPVELEATEALVEQELEDMEVLVEQELAAMEELVEPVLAAMEVPVELEAMEALVELEVLQGLSSLSSLLRTTRTLEMALTLGGKTFYSSNHACGLILFYK